jgi:hypothetical protein
MKTEIIEFNQTDIYCPAKEGQIYVAIKPICKAFGLNHSGQMQRLKRDEMWGQLCVSMPTTGGDSKSYKMACLPLQFVFGWIMTVDTNKVKEEIREALISYKVECCQVLYDHFWNHRDAVQKKEQYLSGIQDEIEQLKNQRKEIGKTIKSKKAEFEKVALTPATQLDLFLTN